MRSFFRANKDKMKLKVYQVSLVLVDKKIRIPVCNFAFKVITVGWKEFSVGMFDQTSTGPQVPDQSKTGKRLRLNRKNAVEKTPQMC
jgi:hypothetical protein